MIMIIIIIIIKNAKSEPVWKKRIHETIECYRKDLAILNELKKVHSEQEHQRTGTKHQKKTPNKSPVIKKICKEK